MSKQIVPSNFAVPEVLETDKIRLRMLTVNDVIKDYDAVMTSIEYLQETKPLGPNKWPTSDEWTLEQELISLGWHQKEFQNKTSFAYTVVSLDEKECLGCMYIYPSSNTEYDVEIVMWVRESELSSDLDKHLFSTVKEWIKEEWPFKNPGYPGRDIEWDAWNAI